jgi:hypothetical protein
MPRPRSTRSADRGDSSLAHNAGYPFVSFPDRCDPMRLWMLAAMWCAFAANHLLAQQTPNWTQVTERAAWQPRDSQGEVVFRDKLWIFGGWFNSFEAPPRDVWSSADGKSWKLVQEQAPWKHSDLSMSLVFDDKMWFMGGWYNGRLAGHRALRPPLSSSKTRCGSSAEPKITISAKTRV